MRETFAKFAVFLAKRRTNKQKLFFIQHLSDIFKELGYELHLVEGKSKLIKIKNLFIGNSKKAVTIIVCSYDNPDKLLFKNPKYYPLNFHKSKTNDKVNLVIQLLIILLSTFFILLILSRLSSLRSAAKTVSILIAVIIFIFSSSVAKGIPNFNNYQRDASISIAYEIAKEIGSDKIAFLFCDYNSSSPLGIKTFFDSYPSLKKKNILYLDSIGTGDTILIGYSKGKSKSAERLVNLISDHSALKRQITNENVSYLSYVDEGVIICTGFLNDSDELYCLNMRTKNDNKIDIELVSYIKELIVRYIANI